MLETKRRVGRPRKNTTQPVIQKVSKGSHNLLGDIDIVLNGLFPKVEKGVLSSEEASAMLRILVHLKVQSKISPVKFKAESY